MRWEVRRASFLLSWSVGCDSSRGSVVVGCMSGVRDVVDAGAARRGASSDATVALDARSISRGAREGSRRQTGLWASYTTIHRIPVFLL